MVAIAEPKLPYGYDELAPHISKETLEFHHGKHHMAYYKTACSLLEGSPNENKSLEQLIQSSEGKLYNQCAQIWNHSFYWKCMKGKANPIPTGPIAEMIDRDFGSFEDFKKKFSEVAAGHFGSGWAWLVLKNGKLEITQTHDAVCPIQDVNTMGVPILTCDVWEHAYYIDYRNSRPEYIKAFWNVVNWDFVNENLKAAQ